jgi:carbon storage regulator
MNDVFHCKEGEHMLVLSRKLGEEIIIDDHIRVTVVAIHGNQVRLGISAPPDVAVHREEVYRQIGAVTGVAAKRREYAGCHQDSY